MMTYASLRRMKKIYNLFSWVVIINLMVVAVPWQVAFAESLDEPPSVVEEIDDTGDEEGVDEDDGSNENEGASDNEDSSNGEDEEDLKVDLPILYIRAINPGYKIDGINNVGEMIEIAKNSDEMISLAGVTVRYTNSSGKETVLVEFPENSYLAGESLLLRLGSAPMSELSNLTYNTTLALKAGPIALSLEDEVIDSICWTGKEGCEKEFTSSKPTILVRDLETGEFEHFEEYEPEYDEKSYQIIVPIHEPDGENCENECEENLNDDIKKDNDEDENLNQKPDDDKKEKNCAEGQYLNEATGRCKKIVVEEKKTCAEGYYLNEETGRCRKNVVEEEKVCKTGYYLNETTGRCRKIVVEEEKTCAVGQYLNPLTGRCKKIETEEEKTCAEGYYLNEATGRCKKIVENDGASYELAVENYEEKSSFVALYAVLGVLGAGIIYIIYEFRREIAKFFKRVFRRK